ncbi:hypothetical protein BC829DRAFT_437924 [Chytridium lagenaria]|nr:hypothetical protein BC829DRAFT_437924 [Chytridium lagenaria]
MAAGAAPQWRVFSFFEKEMVVDADDNSLGPSWLQSMDVTISAGGRGSLFFGDSKGNIALVNHSLSLVFSFQAYQGPVTHMKMMKNRNLLVTIGDDEAGIPVVKVWNLDKMDKSNRAPSLARSTKVQHGNKIFPVTALAVLENMSQIAVGLENGVVLLIRGDISRDRVTKTKVIHESSELVTGLGFHEDVRATSLYIVTLARVLICPTSSKEITATLEEQGAELNCSIPTREDSSQHMLIGRKEAVYFYGPDGRGPCFIIDSQKVSVNWFRNYLVIVSKEDLTPVPPVNLELSRTPRGSSESVYHPAEDSDTKCIAFKGTFGSEKELGIASPKRTSESRKPVPIKCVTSEWGELFIITIDNKMYRLNEKDLATKLDILFKKNLYNLAISMRSINVTETTSTSRGDFDAAVAQYTHTIGSLEASYVIRKFLDAQRIHNLTSLPPKPSRRWPRQRGSYDPSYQLLHETQGYARLDVLLKGVVRGLGWGHASFDVETAMRVCRQAGYYDHALWLAKRFKRHSHCLQILVEDLKRFSDAVEYVASLEPYEEEAELKRYGPVLVTQLPEETTAVLVRLCTTPVGVRKLRDPAAIPRSVALSHDDDDAPYNGSSDTIKSQDVVTLCVQRISCIFYVIGRIGKGSVLNEAKAEEEEDAEAKASLEVLCNTVLELFVGPLGNPMRGIAYRSEDTVGDATPTARTAIKNAEMFTAAVVESFLGSREDRETKSLNLLKHPKARYDLDQALVLCYSNKFREGTLYIYEKLERYADILRYHMEADDYAGVVEACKKYGEIDSSLWPQALSFFAERGTGITGRAEAQANLTEVLDAIDRKNLMPPLKVLEILAKNAAVTVGMVRDYVVRRMEVERRMVEDSKKIANQYRSDATRMRSEIEELKNNPVVFQSNRCALCSQTLDLPTVHFMCKHGYHARCLGEGGLMQGGFERECPRCAPENRTVLDMVDASERGAPRHDVFLAKLEDKGKDRFSVIAEYFGKNVFAHAETAASEA